MCTSLGNTLERLAEDGQEILAALQIGYPEEVDRFRVCFVGILLSEKYDGEAVSDCTVTLSGNVAATRSAFGGMIYGHGWWQRNEEVRRETDLLLYGDVLRCLAALGVEAAKELRPLLN